MIIPKISRALSSNVVAHWKASQQDLSIALKGHLFDFGKLRSHEIRQMCLRTDVLEKVLLPLRVASIHCSSTGNVSYSGRSYARTRMNCPANGNTTHSLPQSSSSSSNVNVCNSVEQTRCCTAIRLVSRQSIDLGAHSQHYCALMSISGYISIIIKWWRC